MRTPQLGSRIPIEKIEARPLTIPTHTPEADGTLAWEKTTIVLVEATAGGTHGLGYTYSHETAAKLVESTLAEAVAGKDAMDVGACAGAMLQRIRNLGRPGICASAIAAVDSALWDLKARILDLPLCRLLGMRRESVPVYGSGGFCNYKLSELQSQLAGWAEAGIPRVKMKIGRAPEQDMERVQAAREAIGPEVELFVDANGAYDRKQALQFAEQFVASGVRWFEEPVSSDDLEGLQFVREHAPATMEIAAGEYGYDPWYFRRMLEAGAVDVLQADGTRCLGISGLLEADALCAASHTPLSLHTAPAFHLHVGCALRSLRHLEYFYDHYRIEQMLFEGAAEPVQGALHPELSMPGNGLHLKRSVAQKFAA
jgi:L-alanine-DL-glutamate epimerase-like enolase superfamily enzyme